MKQYRRISFRKVKTYSLNERKSKVSERTLGAVHNYGGLFRSFVAGLPNVLGARDLMATVKAIADAYNNGRSVVLGMGAHPIKVGLSPIIIDLIKRGIITAVATNGACIVHDFELAYAGHTSEEVACAIKDGSFGMARETGKHLNTAINIGAKKGKGIGKSVGDHINLSRFRHKELSIFSACADKGIPATVHVAIGTDIIHMHPDADGAAIGEGSHKDFKLFCAVVADLEGGVYINLGSAVILPEVFIKALTVARNLDHKVENFTTVNMDFIQHYRARENVLGRPVSSGGSSHALTGHHEIMFPLLAATVIEEIGQK